MKKILFEGKFRRFITRNGWEYTERIRCHEVVVMIPVTDDRKIIFVEQFRIPSQSHMIEFPAGLMNDLDSNQSESREESARRELNEETGYDAGKLEFLVEAPANSALATDVLYVYLATDLCKVGPGGGDTTENIKVHEVPVKEVETWLESQRVKDKFIDFKVYAGLYYLSRKQKDFFL